MGRRRQVPCVQMAPSQGSCCRDGPSWCCETVCDVCPLFASARWTPGRRRGRKCCTTRALRCSSKAPSRWPWRSELWRRARQGWLAGTCAAQASAAAAACGGSETQGSWSATAQYTPCAYMSCIGSTSLSLTCTAGMLLLRSWCLRGAAWAARRGCSRPSALTRLARMRRPMRQVTGLSAWRHAFHGCLCGSAPEVPAVQGRRDPVPMGAALQGMA